MRLGKRPHVVANVSSKTQSLSKPVAAPATPVTRAKPAKPKPKPTAVIVLSNENTQSNKEEKQKPVPSAKPAPKQVQQPSNAWESEGRDADDFSATTDSFESDEFEGKRSSDVKLKSSQDEHLHSKVCQFFENERTGKNWLYVGQVVQVILKLDLTR